MIYSQKSGKGSFLGIAVGETTAALTGAYITPDNNTTKFFAVERPYVVASRSITLATGVDIAAELLWVNNTGRTMTVKKIVVRSTNRTANSDMDIKKVASATAFASGVALTAAAVAFDAYAADTNGVPALHGTAANLDLADGDSIQFDITNDASGDNTDTIISVALAPAVAAVTFPNI